jgi:hypothetical protein
MLAASQAPDAPTAASRSVRRPAELAA